MNGCESNGIHSASSNTPSDDEEEEEEDMDTMMKPSTELNPNEMATMTEPDKLGPCEPGTAVKLNESSMTAD